MIKTLGPSTERLMQLKDFSLIKIIFVFYVED